MAVKSAGAEMVVEVNERGKKESYALQTRNSDVNKGKKKKMSEKYKFSDPEGIYFATATIVFWIDLFTRPAYKHIIIDALKHCQKEKGPLAGASL